MKKYLNLYRIILKTFGFKLRPVGTFGLIQLHRLINDKQLRISMGEYGRVAVKSRYCYETTSMLMAEWLKKLVR